MRPATANPPAWSGERIQRLRTIGKLTQRDLAARLGVRQATVADWESEKVRPSRMARKALDVVAREIEIEHRRSA